MTGGISPGGWRRAAARKAAAPLILAASILGVPGPARAGGGAAAEAGVPAADISRVPRVLLELEIWWAAPANLGLDYAFFDASGALSGGGEVRTVTGGSRAEPRLRAAWVSGLEGAPTFGATFWEWDGTFDSDTGVHPAMIGALLASPDFAIGRSLVDSAAATSRIRGTLVDADLAWRHGLDGRAQLGFAMGLRFFRFEQRMDVAYAAERSGAMLEEFVIGASDARGAGPRGSIRFGYRFGGRVTFAGELGLALPVGSIEGEASDSAFVDGSFDRATVVELPSRRRVFPQIDGALVIEVAAARRLALWAAYRYTVWSGVTLSERFVDDVSQNTALPLEGDVAFTGLATGLRYEF